MRGYIANTDYEWYRFLCAQQPLAEVNFWQPSGGRGFHSIEPGSPFIFKLKKPHYVVAGFGYLVRHSILPAWLAWNAFERANGAPDFLSMRKRILHYRQSTGAEIDRQLNIGCLLVAEPVFLEQSEWVEQPNDWSPTIVQGKSYDPTRGEGKRIWDRCRLAIQSRAHLVEEVALPSERYGESVLVQPRLGQGSFRVGVIEAYRRACAVTSEHSLPALEAAHIKPYSIGGEHKVSNGLLLRSDIHRLFDQGYVTVTPDYHFEVSRRLKEDYENGKSYYPHHGKLIEVPVAAADRAEPTLLNWHNSEVFLE